VLYSAHIANHEAKGNWQHGLQKNTILLRLTKGGPAHNKSRWRRERKKQSKQKKQSLLAAMLLVSAERERERADDGQTKVSFASREPKKYA
jgi:hypothetical protein